MLDKYKNFWIRFFGNFVQGDIIEIQHGEGGIIGTKLGVYHSSHKVGEFHNLILAYGLEYGTIQAEGIVLTEKGWSTIKLIKKVEETGSEENSLRELRRMRGDGREDILP